MSFDLTPGEDQRQILDAAQSMLEMHYPVARLREAGHQEDLGAIAEFGTYLLSLPEEAGGAGFTFVEEAQLHALLGQHLVSPGSIAAAVAVRIALASGDNDLAEAMVGGAQTVCAGVARPDDLLLIEPFQAVQGLILAGDTLHLVPLAGVDLVAVPSLGHGRPMARAALTLDGSNAARADAATRHYHALLTSARLLGVATLARDLAVDYAKTREQFGQPIGAFQAVKHHCANMAIGVEMLSAQLDMAAIALRDGREDAAFQVAAMARLAPRIALENARTGIQVHGGIGFSAEADAQLCLKQAHILRQFLGAPDLMSEDAPMAPLRKANP
ncbi:acyl-CoA dehydrogenase family protein [Pseudooceanicola sp.]|uniref:acyl-CoA dehydrogenase family protein n=1 Tax=Pseudooceanicola sp. TaxID=1914328 RepID=UPI0035C6DE21